MEIFNSQIPCDNYFIFHILMMFSISKYELQIANGNSSLYVGCNNYFTYDIHTLLLNFI